MLRVLHRQRVSRDLSEDPFINRTTRHGPVALALSFMIVSVLNVVPATNQIPSGVPRYEVPIEPQPRDDLRSMTEEHEDFVRAKYLFYLQLGEVIDGRPLITSGNGYLDPGQTLGLSRSDLLIRDHDPEVADDVGATLLGLPAYRGTLWQHGKGRVPYVIVRTASQRSGSRFRAVIHEGSLVIVDEVILDALRERGA